MKGTLGRSESKTGGVSIIVDWQLGEGSVLQELGVPSGAPGSHHVLRGMSVHTTVP